MIDTSNNHSMTGCDISSIIFILLELNNIHGWFMGNFFAKSPLTINIKFAFKSTFFLNNQE